MSFGVLGAHFIIFVSCRLTPEIFDPFAVADCEMFSQMNCSQEQQMHLAACVQGGRLYVEINSAASEYILRYGRNRVVQKGNQVFILLKSTSVT